MLNVILILLSIHLELISSSICANWMSSVRFLAGFHKNPDFSNTLSNPTKLFIPMGC